MDREPRRIIEAVVFAGGIGVLSADELLAMPNDEWGVLRDRLTDGRQGKANGLTARCTMCETPVYIQTRPLRGRSLPYFAHFKGAPPDCPWHHAKNMTPDQAKAAQYGGRQESPAHRQLCNLIDELIRLDPRYKEGSVGKYVAPTESEYGRYPDVYAKLESLPPLAFEVQLSQTFQTEISARCIHYEREKAGLIWVMHGAAMDGPLPQSFLDVIRRHRGNAFVLDNAATTASFERKTLMLSCYRRASETTFDKPILVSLDDLTFPADSLPYKEDRITKNLVAGINARRKPWHDALKQLERPWYTSALRTTAVSRLMQQATATMPGVFGQDEDENFISLRLIGTLFSILATANNKPRNYVTNHENVSGLLNTLLDANTKAGGLQRHALLVETALQRTPLKLKDTVQKHIDQSKAQQGSALGDANDAAWKGMAYLFPEILDPFVREELRYLGALPLWATPT